MIKAYRLRDLVGGYVRVDNHREQLSQYEHSDTIIEEGYFMTKEDLQKLVDEVKKVERYAESWNTFVLEKYMEKEIEK